MVKNNNPKKMGINVKRSNRKLFKFYLLHPPKDANADNIAEKLISFSNVEEVFVTDGDYGFVVKARFLDDKENDDAYKYLSKKLGSGFGKVTSHYQYSK
jgi:DNA-binding Lrp family transcriptional regulator